MIFQESQTVEFKESWKDEYLKTVCAYDKHMNDEEIKSDYDCNYEDKKCVHDKGKSVYGGEKSEYDGVHDDGKSVNGGVYDEKILVFSLLPKSRKEIMDLLGISMHTNNHERHIVPLLEKGFIAMTFPDKPNNKNQKYITTEKGKELINKNMRFP